jgi:hypothetical protein
MAVINISSCRFMRWIIYYYFITKFLLILIFFKLKLIIRIIWILLSKLKLNWLYHDHFSLLLYTHICNCFRMRLLYFTLWQNKKLGFIFFRNNLVCRLLFLFIILICLYMGRYYVFLRFIVVNWKFGFSSYPIIKRSWFFIEGVWSIEAPRRYLTQILDQLFFFFIDYHHLIFWLWHIFV